MISTYTKAFFCHGEEMTQIRQIFKKKIPNHQIFVISIVAKKIEGSFKQNIHIYIYI
jgi:hypothetical protein